MKKLIIAAALAAAGLANAGTLMTGPTNSGNTASFNDTTSKRCRAMATSTGEAWNYAESVTASGVVEYTGCWSARDDKIVVEWYHLRTGQFFTTNWTYDMVSTTAYYDQLQARKRNTASGREL